jgi:hypothetical protein
MERRFAIPPTLIDIDALGQQTLRFRDISTRGRIEQRTSVDGASHAENESNS